MAPASSPSPTCQVGFEIHPTPPHTRYCSECQEIDGIDGEGIDGSGGEGIDGSGGEGTDGSGGEGTDGSGGEGTDGSGGEGTDGSGGEGTDGSGGEGTDGSGGEGTDGSGGEGTDGSGGEGTDGSGGEGTDGSGGEGTDGSGGEGTDGSGGEGTDGSGGEGTDGSGGEGIDGSDGEGIDLVGFGVVRWSGGVYRRGGLLLPHQTGVHGAERGVDSGGSGVSGHERRVGEHEEVFVYEHLCALAGERGVLAAVHERGGDRGRVHRDALLESAGGGAGARVRGNEALVRAYAALGREQGRQFAALAVPSAGGHSRPRCVPSGRVRGRGPGCVGGGRRQLERQVPPRPERAQLAGQRRGGRVRDRPLSLLGPALPRAHAHSRCARLSPLARAFVAVLVQPLGAFGPPRVCAPGRRRHAGISNLHPLHPHCFH